MATEWAWVQGLCRDGYLSNRLREKSPQRRAQQPTERNAMPLPPVNPLQTPKHPNSLATLTPRTALGTPTTPASTTPLTLTPAGTSSCLFSSLGRGSTRGACTTPSPRWDLVYGVPSAHSFVCWKPEGSSADSAKQWPCLRPAPSPQTRKTSAENQQKPGTRPLLFFTFPAIPPFWRCPCLRHIWGYCGIPNSGSAVFIGC